MSDIQQKLRASILRYNMFGPHANVGVAVSGGADSTALLCLLVDLAKEWNVKLKVLHLNHCLRGKQSDEDEASVRRLAKSFGLPVITKRTDLSAVEENLEQEARNARRQFYFDAIVSNNVHCVALGHTRNDQAETVLFRLLRGAYTTGLSGMRPVTREGLVRPMLNITRQEVEDFLRSRGVSWREDASNQDFSFARNRIRYQLLPELTKSWNLNLTEVLANHAELARDDEDYWAAASTAFDTVRHNGAILANVNSLKALMPALRRRVIRDIIRQCKGDLLRIDFRHIEQLMVLLEAVEGHGRAMLPGVDIMRSFDWLRFVKPRSSPQERDWNFDIEIGPVTTHSIPGSGTEIVVELRTTGTSPNELHVPHDTLGVVELDWKRICHDSVSLSLRNWRPGDRMRPAGRTTEEKVKTLFQEARVALWDRRNWPMLCAGDRIIWTRSFGGSADLVANQGDYPVLRIFERKRINPESGRELATS